MEVFHYREDISLSAQAVTTAVPTGEALTTHTNIIIVVLLLILLLHIMFEIVIAKTT